MKTNVNLKMNKETEMKMKEKVMWVDMQVLREIIKKEYKGGYLSKELAKEGYGGECIGKYDFEKNIQARSKEKEDESGKGKHESE